MAPSNVQNATHRPLPQTARSPNDNKRQLTPCLTSFAGWPHHPRVSVKFSDTSTHPEGQGKFIGFLLFFFFFFFPHWTWGRRVVISCRDLIHWLNFSANAYGLWKSDQSSLQVVHRSGHFCLSLYATIARAASALYFLQTMRKCRRQCLPV